MAAYIPAEVWHLKTRLEPAQVTAWVGDQAVQRTASYYLLMIYLGLSAFVSSFIVAQVVNVPGGYRWVFWGVAAIGFLASLRLFTLGESPRAQHTPSPTAEQDNRRLELPIIVSSALFLFFYVGAEV